MKEPLKFRRKPEAVEAVQLVPENLQLLTEWLPPGASVRITAGEGVSIEWPTILGPILIKPGDWVFRDASGVLQSLTGDQFEARYERDISAAQMTTAELFGDGDE